MRRLVWTTCVSGLAALGGCSSGPLQQRETRYLNPAEFAVAPADPGPRVEPPAVNRPRGVPITGPIAASEGMVEVRAEPMQFDPADDVSAIPVEGAVLVDAKVGDINGRAIYAAPFLEEMGARLMQAADEMLRQTLGRVGNPRDVAEAQWRTFTREQVRLKLKTEIEDELLRAEALASLTPQMRQGFRAFMQDIESKLYSETGGSRVLAERKLLEEEGISAEQWYRTREQRELIQFELSRRIYNRVNVAWRDIVLEYERRQNIFNPGSKVELRMIRVTDSNEEGLRIVAERLAAGEPFAEVAASDVNEYRRESGGLRDPVELKGPYEEASLGLAPPLEEVARKLTPGSYAGPVDLGEGRGASKVWLYLEPIEAGPSAPLFIAQAYIEDALRASRMEREKYRYIERLKKRASFTDLDEMARKLVNFAAEKYFDPVAAAQGL